MCNLSKYFLLFVNAKIQNKEIIKIQALIFEKLWVISNCATKFGESPPTRNDISVPKAVVITECSSFSFSNELPLSDTDESESYCISSSVLL